MNPRETQSIGHPLSRRGFLEKAAAATGGAMIAPGLMLTAIGCRQTASISAAGASNDDPGVAIHDLRVSSFSGAPDGRVKEVLAYNGQLPGPVIRVKEGQTLRVRVINDLTVPTSVHWHGMHQPGTWRMDGVEGVSGPPIAPGAEFVYEFRATPAGTHWYHSHAGVQYGDGLFGPLIVEERVPIAKYDREEILMVNDWFQERGDALLAQLVARGQAKMAGKMDMKGGKDIADVPFQSGLVNGKGRIAGDVRTPLTVVSVRRGEIVRLRLINASSTYALRFQIDGHPLTVIASDGSPLKPVAVDNLMLTNGERYDVLLEAGGSGVHWIRAVTLDGNEILAVLRYEDAAEEMPQMQPVRWSPRALTLEQARSPQPVAMSDTPREIVLTLGGTMMPYRWSINDQYYPEADPIEITRDEVTRFVLRNPTGMDHPFHLHGHSFHVLGRLGELNLTDPPLKDTINVPSKENIVIQWTADNPGNWFFHCHIEWHLATGMARVINIK